MIGLIQKAYMEGHRALPLTASLFAHTDMGIENFPFDLFIDESHGLEFMISEHPLQDGAVITDHVTQKLRQCKITGMFTNHSVRRNRGNTETISIAGYEDAQPLENVARQKYTDLEDLAKRREPVRLVTSLIAYPKMLIKSIKTSRDDKSGESIKFTMTLTEFKTVQLFNVSSDLVYGQGSMKDAVDRLTANVKKGGLTSGTVHEVNKLFKMLGAQ
ncbi:hypothetical protein SAMN05720470_10849 [Fibrobacter sp. UWOV1]|uniref:phage baseplate protein n=1 Tax=Fibrobacter sp. UWOV1 TaxID=1896215 RepID=UPI000917F518|nr:hypothetical protein [Fibrobacter sp. UWOV1]SHL42549.1 hypothetical protein SAMN05720470_10849 [Fibrobacter sp. UWOV1]